MRITKSEIQRFTALFITHQGTRKALTKESLFKEWFGEDYTESPASLMYTNRAKWDYIRRLMKWMRKKSPYFVVNRYTGTGFEYYLATSNEDGQYFNDRLDSIVSGIRKVQQRYQNYLRGQTVTARVRRKRGARHD